MTTFYLGLPNNKETDLIDRALNNARVGGLIVYPEMRDHTLAMARRMPFWCLDSGAFLLHNRGRRVDVCEYADVVARLCETPEPPREVFGLDVIGDWRTSVRNYRELDQRGLKTIPTWHLGDPESLLVELARSYPKIAVGGIAKALKTTERTRFLEQVFARIWPARVHGFGVMDRQTLMTVPFHSVDSTSWLSPLMFGNWRAYGRSDIRSRKPDLSAERKYYENLAAEVSAKWRHELARLDP